MTKRKQPEPEPGKATPLDPAGPNKARPVKRKPFPNQTDPHASHGHKGKYK